MQTISDRGLKEIVGHEGVVLEPYYDSVHVLTVYVGHTKPAGAPDPATMWGKTGTVQDALAVLRKDLETVMVAVRNAFGRPLTQEQFDAAVSFHFNCNGIGRATWVKSFKAGNFSAARKEFMNWRRPAEIIPRRERERDLFFDGTYHWGGKATLYTADAQGRVDWGSGKTIVLP